MKFNMRQSVDKTEYILDFFITRKSLKLIDNIFNKFYHQFQNVTCRGKFELNISFGVIEKIMTPSNYLELFII